MKRMRVVATMATLVVLGLAAAPVFAAMQDATETDHYGSADDQMALQRQGSEDATGWNEDEETSAQLAESSRAISALAEDLNALEQGADQAVEFDDDSDPTVPYTL